jgi:dienelactone hydrolase
MMRSRCLILGLIGLLLLTACRSAAAPTPTIPPPTAIPANQATPTTSVVTALEATPTSPPPTATQPPLPTATEPPVAPTETPAPAPSLTPEQPALPALPPDPQRIEFQTEDGAQLVGYYYPAAVNPAPLVVLMHWAGGNQTDWQYVGMAAWLQNRGIDIPAAPGPMYFDTPYPFQPLPEGATCGVFTFDFRGYGESAPSGDPQKQLVLDAQAAYTTAAALPGVDPGRVVGIGASIGADGVVDGCNEACMAALSLSPGSYLEVAYTDAVKTLDDLGKPIWCVAAQDDEPALQACQAAAGEHYLAQIYPSGGHAMRLFREENNLQPPIESVILDFLALTFGMP